ncbi:hypothetical protein I7I50_10939 [Histoplasma capsulatum G186AR]|uniref:Uncharacterized protein n=1 Tax=Ajellomyces capsulatus TaxID=5037 RepID=A0A8H7Z738_AJECA|nr:hypothetical protein I7I52_02177 [Histoplasma capsulatum]QSS69595.1 hypothetical protein I7I50_10939 [Histoplasma capsulatum G186AR]
MPTDRLLEPRKSVRMTIADSPLALGAGRNNFPQVKGRLHFALKRKKKKNAADWCQPSRPPQHNPISLKLFRLLHQHSLTFVVPRSLFSGRRACIMQRTKLGG